MKDRADISRAEDILPETLPFSSIRSMIEHSGDASAKMPAIAAVGDHPDAGHVVELLQRVKGSRKLLVLPRNGNVPGPFIVRHDDVGQCPPLFVAGGCVFLPLDGQWIGVKSPNASRVIWRVGFSHLVAGEVNPAEEKIFFCDCGAGCLTIESGGNGWLLRCSNCGRQRPLSLPEAKLKVRLNGMTCPDEHPLTVRRSNRGELFLSCENYPFCTHTATLSLLRGL